MATTTKKGSKNKRAKLRASVVKTSPGEQAQTIAELRRELEARNRDLAALYDVTAAAGQSLEIKPVLEEVVKKITDIFGFDSVSVFLFDPKNEVLNLMAAAGIHEIQALPRAFRRGRGLTGKVAESGQYLIFEDVRSDPRYQQMTENNAMQRMGSCFIAIFPIKAKEKFLGTINCINTEPRKLTTGEIRLINSMADQIGVAVENINLFEEVKNKTKDLESSNAELREALEHQTATSEVLGIISRSPTDVQPVLDAIVASAARVCGIDDVVLRLHQENTSILRAHFGSIPIGRVEVSIDRPDIRWMRDHGTLHVPDMDAQRDEFPTLGLVTGFRTYLSAPLRQKGEVIGTLNARRMEVRPFTPAQIKLLETFADQAVIAIENVRLFNELKESLEQQTATSEILGVIASSPTDIQPVLDVVVERAARLCDASHAVIHRVDGDLLRRVAVFGGLSRGPVGAEAAMDRGKVSHRAVLDRQVIHVHDLATKIESEFPGDADVVQRLGIRTHLSVPLMREEVAIGVIIIHRTEVRPFTDKQIALLKTFADQAVIAIENVRLFQELQNRNRQLSESLEQQTATSEILSVISGSPTELAPVFNTILANACRLCSANLAGVSRYDGEFLRGQSVYNASPEFAEVFLKTPFKPGPEGPIRKAALERRIIHVEDLVADPEFAAILLPIERARTVLAVPLLKESTLVGVVAMWRQEVQPFTDKQIALVKTFADQAVIAIENVRLFQELKEALEQQTATSKILGVIASSPTDIQPVLDTVAENAAQVCGANDALIFRLNADVLEPVASWGMIPLSTIARERGVVVNRATVVGRAVVDRQTIHVQDLAAELDTEFPEAKPYQQQIGWRTTLATPLMREGNPIGAIHIRRMEVCPFSDRQMKLLETFASQAVIAIENVRLFKELQERNAELREALEHQTATAEVLGIISRSPTDVQPVLDAIVESAAKVCGIDDVILRLPEGNVIVPRAHFGPIPINRVEINIDEPFFRWMREHGTLHIPDVRAQTDFPLVGHSGIWRTGLYVPLRQQGELIGYLTARRIEVRPFTPPQIKLLETFADQAVIAIENVRLFNELKESLEQQTATSEILGVIASSPTDIQPVLDTIAENAARVCGSDDATIRLIEENTVSLVAHYGMISPGMVKRPLGMRTPGNEAILQRKTVHIPDVLAEADRFPDSGARDPRGIRTFLVTPLLREGIAIGVINIRRTEVKPFTDKQVALLETFASQAVIAIENVRLFKELQERTRELMESVEEMKALGEVGQAVSSTVDLQTVLSTIVRHAVQLSGTNCGIIYEYDEPTQEFHLRASYQMEQELVNAYQATPLRLGQGATGRAAETRTPTQIADLRQEQEFATRGMRPILSRLGYQSLLAVPLLLDQKIMGALTIYRRQTGSFAAEVVNLLQTFATQSVLAIQNARLFREIEEKSKQIEAANRHKSEFLANMSHELRTPLNAIIGFSEALGERLFGELNEKQAEYTEDILSSGRHLLSLINEILDLSKVEAGRMELELAKFDLPLAIDNARTFVRERATKHGINLDVTVDERLGDFVGDERKIKQILLNLLSNAVKFTPEGGRIGINAKHADGSVEISVSDTGIGIAPEDQAKIFEEFRQVGSDDSHKIEGTGLGLTLAKKFVELHGGKDLGEKRGRQGLYLQLYLA